MITAAAAGPAAAIPINADMVQKDVERAVDDHQALGEVVTAAAVASLATTVLGDRRHRV